MKAVVAAFNQEKALVGAFSVITNLRMELFQALISIHTADCSTLASPEGGFVEQLVRQRGLLDELAEAGLGLLDHLRAHRHRSCTVTTIDR